MIGGILWVLGICCWDKFDFEDVVEFLKCVVSIFLF